MHNDYSLRIMTTINRMLCENRDKKQSKYLQSIQLIAVVTQGKKRH